MFPDIDAAPILAGTVPFGQAIETHWYVMHGNQYVCKLHGDRVLRYWHNGNGWVSDVNTCYNKDLPLQPVKMRLTFMPATPPPVPEVK